LFRRTFAGKLKRKDCSQIVDLIDALSVLEVLYAANCRHFPEPLVTSALPDKPLSSGFQLTVGSQEMRRQTTLGTTGEY